MELRYRSFFLEFKHPFGVSSNTRTHTPTVFLRLEHNGVYGYGEACVPKYLGETIEDTINFFEKARLVLSANNFETGIDDLFEKIDLLAPYYNAAKAALNIGLNDLWSKLNGKPFYELAGIGKSEPAFTSATIGIDNPEMIALKVEEAKEFSILKIKAGTRDDKALIELIRKFTDKPLYVDVNQGWTNKEQVLEMLNWMKEKNVLLVEQPMPINMLDEMRWVSERSPVPTIADESVKRLKDLDNIKGVFSGINIKLMKCAGLNEAIEMIEFCRKSHLKIMLGCMAESSCATTAMAQLMHLADYVDLDAPNLIKNDPFRGILYEQGKVILNNLPGLGAELKDNSFFS
jgi:L-alanine-DL-glutamate epimerase-like enolase superfamily enzyme